MAEPKRPAGTGKDRPIRRHQGHCGVRDRLSIVTTHERANQGAEGVGIRRQTRRLRARGGGNSSSDEPAHERRYQYVSTRSPTRPSSAACVHRVAHMAGTISTSPSFQGHEPDRLAASMPLTGTNLISGLPMMRTRPTLCYPALTVAASIVSILTTATLLPAQAPNSSASGGNDAAQLVEQGRKLNDEGKQQAALGLYERALKGDPGFFDAHLAAAVALDLEGSYDAAREHLRKALASPQPDSLKVRALRTMAVSYAFTRNAADAAKYEHEVIDPALARQDFVGAADVDNELARIYLESGDIDNAYKTYEAGHTTALRKTALTPAEHDLWDFRWEHAQARIGARRGQREAAMQHITAAKAILDRGTNPDQARFFPYLTGYVALYLLDYKAAIADLQKADQHDPFILCLMAQAYEKLGDKANATDLYHKILAINSHNPPNAFARPIAKEKVGG